MTISFSDDIYKAMGFQDFATPGAISATFSSMAVYGVTGITILSEAAEQITGSVAGVSYRVAIATSVNAASNALAGIAFANDEQAWKTEKNCAGPFAIVQIGPTAEHVSEAGRKKVEENGNITTYDCFPTVRTELRELEAKAHSPILTALACIFNEDGRYVSLRNLDRVFVGRTGKGEVIHDIYFTMSGEIGTAYNLSDAQLRGKLLLAKNFTEAMNPKAARFFALGIAETDQLKKFLFFFLTLEIETHAAFLRIDQEKPLLDIFPNGLLNTGGKPFETGAQVKTLRYLYDRFFCCAAYSWPHLNPEDRAQFKALKKVRDDIAHGSIAEPPLGCARQVEVLAQKVLYAH